MEFDPNLPWRTIHGHGFNAHVGPVSFARVSDSEWRFFLDIEAHHINIGGVCHGGVSLTLADIGMGSGAYAAGGNRPCTTIQMDAHFIAAAKKGQRLLGAARLVRATHELAFMECELHAGGRQTLRASGVWKYLSPRKG
ncbi:PaaI family thioesterase [Oceanicella actignis]|uniref:Medium/long-chain acyl-CoA thioesterase YigI n=1 Tax=Oceanicella actignis TaxID=1189325 RepID=A0A1M7RRL0_9RHOB|nr:PaaI family thioesterase [Oceanicella actignis]SET06877.1 uncharacterized domain 1-containing protein [Oceanicella actignis]SHN48894.1 uncharacterized domain 1-containing protein [Oceanicella actignis]